MSVPSGFIPRTEAQEQYSRSKMSFIRDVDAARKRNDSEFLTNFIVVLKDGSTVEGQRATKQFLRENDSKKPEWYIKESLLKSKYWATKKQKVKASAKPKAKKENEAGESGASSSSNRYIQLLEETNRQNQIQISEQLSLIKELSEHQRQSNVLVKSLTDLLGRSGVLNEPQYSSESVAERQRAPQPSTRPKTDDIAIVEVTDTPSSPDVPSKQTSSEKEPGETQRRSIWQRDLLWFINDRLNK